MTTFTQFNPPLDAPFRFSAQLDGASYTITDPWNLFSQRWYVQVVDQYGNIVFLLPQIESQATVTLSSLIWSQEINSGQVTATTQVPMPYPLGSIVNLTIYGAQPTTYNGAWQCLVTSPQTFTFTLPTDPGLNTTPGAYAQDVSITAGYFTSTLVWRPETGNFEVSP